jgi:hypothetical protein
MQRERMRDWQRRQRGIHVGRNGDFYGDFYGVYFNNEGISWVVEDSGVIFHTPGVYKG